MPCGNRVWLGTRWPLESRLVSAQQSSRLTYWYPAALRPLATKMSAIPLTIASLKSARHWVEFQLLKPIGGGQGEAVGRALARGGGERRRAAVPPRGRPAG